MGLRGVKQAHLQGNTKEATTFEVAFSMDRPLDMMVQIVHAGKTDAVMPEQPCRSNDNHDPADRGHSGRRAGTEQGRTSVDPSLGDGKYPRK